MTRSVRNFYSTDETGAIIPLAEISVNFAGGAEAPIYTTSSGGVPVTQPLISTASGKATFYIEPGVYDIASQDPISLTTSTFANEEIGASRASLTKDKDVDFYFSTAEDLINNEFDQALITDVIANSFGYSAKGDGGGAEWQFKGVTGQTPSQSPAQLGNDNLLNDGNGNQWELVEGSSPLNPLAVNGTSVSSDSDIITPSSVADTDIFLDSLRMNNFHTTGADIDTYTFLIDDDKFRINEASRSYDKKIGVCENVLFVGDSLTAYVASDGSYTSTVSEKLSNEAGGIKEVGYLAAESNSVSAKQNFYGLTVSQSGFSYLNAGGFLYTDDERRFSPDGKGVSIAGADGSRFYYWNVNSSSLVRYTKYKLYYLQQPTGGTFDLRNRGATLNPVDTSGALSLQSVEFSFVDNGDPLNKDIRAENVTGDVTIYGVELIDELTTDGYSYDVFATSGGELFELLQLESTSLQTVIASRNFDTVVINIGTNDSTGGRTPAEFITDLDTYISNITTALPGVKFVITSPNNMQFTNFTGSTRAIYENERRKYCRENELMYIDTCSELGNFNYFVALDMMRDGTHPNIKGQEYIGLMVSKKLLENKSDTVINPTVPAELSETVMQAYSTFDGDGGVINITNEVGCTMTRTALGAYKLTFDDELLDNYYSVINETPEVNIQVVIRRSEKGTSQFTIRTFDIAGAAIEISTANPLSVSVIGRSKPRL